MNNTKPLPHQPLADEVADRLNADIWFYAGPTDPPSDSRFIETLVEQAKRPNVLLMLTTHGGCPNTAYRIARAIRRVYASGQHILFVDSDCKSAGTLIALGCDELVMSDFAELGPIDIQTIDREEVGQYSSGLVPVQALSTLRRESLTLFEECFKTLRFGGRFSTKMAAQVAGEVAVGLMKSLYEQLDPMRLGEQGRAMMIASEYGPRLASGNLKPNALDCLIAGYPCHEFVIDREEAGELFNSVRSPEPDEIALAEMVSKLAGQSLGRDAANIMLLSTPQTPPTMPDASATRGASDENGTATPNPRSTEENGRESPEAVESSQPQPNGEARSSPGAETSPANCSAAAVR